AQRPYMMDEVGGVKKKVVAHIPATVAVFIKNSTHPFRQDMVIPVYGETSVKTGDILTGHFTVDLLPDGKPLLPAGEYVAYLFVEGQTFGPERFELLPAPK
ncbi:MAG: hypothetical protein OEW08_14895, partial [Gammaproteobacteria bacterium]|nr:hypothetical protein [Gammaproteobacteria bacterium]